MILQKKTINNVPTLVPLTADTGSGVPVGTIIGQYKKVNMSGYLYLDGSTFDQTLYPALYAYLGTNVLPDYREFVLVGAEQNTTSATIAVHDVFTQGQEKDDQLQDIGSPVIGEGISPTMFIPTTSPGNWAVFKTGLRMGTTTRTKEKAVFWYIKATTGIIESEATEMLNIYNEQNSYSTSEINTGKKWIDGKPIYRKVIDLGNLPDSATATISTGITNADRLAYIGGVAQQSSADCIPLPYVHMSNNSIQIWLSGNMDTLYISTSASWSNHTGYAILEYTKTTD